MRYRGQGLLAWALLAALGCGSSKAGRNETGGGAPAGENTSGGGLGGQSGTSGASSSGGTMATGGSPGSGGATSSGGTTSAGGMTTAAGTAGVAGASAGSGGTPSGGAEAAGGMAMSAGMGGGEELPTSALVTSTNGTWATSTWIEAPSATADITVDETSVAQTWEGFGGAFHEMGWNLLTTQALEDEALSLLFGADGAKLALARIPIGASDYALERYTLDDTGTDVLPDGAASNRPSEDLSLSGFSIERDKQTLIPHIKGALAKNPKLRFWAIPWTPPVWMKTGYKTNGTTTDPATRPSFFDGGKMKSEASTLAAYAQYLVQFVRAYAAEGIAVDTVAFQDEPTFEQNYPSCTWDKATYVTYVGQYLGPALAIAGLGTKIMLGDLANEPNDSDLVSAVMSDPAAKPFVGAIGVEWNVLAKVETTPLTYQVPLWVTEHKCGNYPFINSPQAETATSPAIGAYVEPAPNDQAYGVESWWYIRDAITKAKVTAYNVPHLVLDPMGKGADTSRQWSQNSLLVVDQGTIKTTQTYYVVRHFSEFVDPGATVIKTTGGDAVAFKNPNGSLVAVLFSAAGKSDLTVAIGGKKLRFAVPAGGWATVKYVP